MGLKAYQEAFMAERVNGEVLLECDEDVLLNELKVDCYVHNQLHTCYVHT